MFVWGSVCVLWLAEAFTATYTPGDIYSQSWIFHTVTFLSYLYVLLSKTGYVSQSKFACIQHANYAQLLESLLVLQWRVHIYVIHSDLMRYNTDITYTKNLYFSIIDKRLGYYSLCSRGGGTPILEHGGELPLYWPPFVTFSDPIWVPFYVQFDLIDPLFLQKKSVCLYHI